MKRFTTIALLSIIFLVLTSSGFAQTMSNYAGANFAASSGTFTALSGGTTVPSLLADDAVSTSVPIGFAFYYMGKAYTSAIPSSNGFLSLATSATSDLTNNLSTGASRPYIAPLWDDMDGRATGAVASYSTTGTAGSRVFTFEWLNWARTGGTSPVVSFQARLFESTGIIQFVYRSDAGTFSGSASIGLSTTATGSGNFVSLSDATAAPTTSTTTETTTISTKPATGQTYTFTPPQTAVADPITLSFTSVTVSSMTVNWVDNSSNETNFNVFRSTDGINYSPVGTSTSTSVATTGTAYNLAQTSLTPGTTYFYQVVANSEGIPSTALSGSQATSSPSFSGTKAIGPSGGADYATITAAIAAIASQGLAGAAILELQPTYLSSAEPGFPIVIPALAGSSATNTITIRPQTGASALSITSASTTATIDLNGGSYIIFDGRPGGTGTPKQLTIDNTSISGSAFRLINDATQNIIRYCTISGVNTSTSGGVVLFSNTTGTTGNDNNTVDNNDIRDGATTPTNGIYSSGTTTTAVQNNSGNTISNNNIFNFFAAAAASQGISIGTGNTDWTISGNSIYQTATRTATSAATHTGILVSNSSGNNFTISGNYIGGGAANALGTAWTIGGTVANRFIGIQLTVGTTTASNIQGNTIANFTWSSTSGATTLPYVWIGIYTTAGNTNIGTTSGNTIGSGSGTGSISVTISTTGGVSGGIGISNGSGGTANVQNNIIGSMTLLGSTTGISHTFRAIDVSSVTNLTISGNTIGSTSTANSINLSTASTSTTGQEFTGIRQTSSLPTATISNNTIANINNAYAGTATTAMVRGIVSSAGVNTISGNTIRNMTNASPQVGTTTAACVQGIAVSTSTSGTQTVSQNAVHSLFSTAAANGVSVIGIILTWTSAGTQTCERNLVHSLVPSSTLTTTNVYGIYASSSSGTATFKNNMVRLGIDAAGASITNPHQTIGIYDFLGTNSYYHNSVYIGGSGVTNTQFTYAFKSDVTTNTRAFQNNIFVNDRSYTSSGTSNNVAAFASGTLPNPTGLTINYNIYKASGTGGVLFRNSTTNYTTLSAWQSASGLDGSSGVGDPNYVNATGTSSTVDLHVTGTTPAEGAGTNIASVTDDYDGQTRSSFTPVDIGADAGSFTGLDIFAPAISFTALSNGLAGTSRTVSSFATITDNLAVSTGANLPRIYYKKSTDANAFSGNTSADNGWKYVAASNATSPFSFAIDYTIINGGSVIAGDIIQYFVVAQDDANNLSSRSAGASAGSSPPVQNINAYSGTANSYTIALAYSGTYSVGTGQTYTTLTGASPNGLFAALNGGVVTGNITVSIVSDMTEPGTNGLNQQAEDGAGAGTYTITIQPDAASMRTLSGAVAGPMINLNGSDRVTIDGRFGGSGRFLTFRNTNTSNATIAFQNDATNNTLRSSIIEGATISSSNGTVFFSSTASTTGNDNNTVTDNLIRDLTTAAGVPANAIYSVGFSSSISNSGNSITSNEIFNWTTAGVSLSATGNGDGWTISNNALYQTASRTTALTAIGVLGVGNNQTVNNNSIGGGDATRGGTAMTTSSNFFGINLSVGTTTASNVQGNLIGNIITNATTTTNYGIQVGAGTVNIGTTAGNTIGGVAANDISAANSFTGILVTSSASIVDIRNNIVRNLRYQAADFEGLIGVSIAGGSATVKDNTIRDFLHKGTTTGSLPSAFAPDGIYVTGGTGHLIEGNTIHNILLDGNAASDLTTTYQIGGIVLNGSSITATITRNRIYGLTTTRTITGSTAPTIAGIWNASSAAVTASNNQISLSQSTASTQPLMRGILHSASTGTFNYYYNSAYVAGTAAATNSTYGFYRTATSGTLFLRNNLLYNERSGTGNHFPIGTSSTTGWVATTANYNLLVGANSANIGDWGGTPLTFTNWRAAQVGGSGGDTSSYSDVNTNISSANLFTDVANGNLNINTANAEAWYVNGKGIAGSSSGNIAVDYASEVRGTSQGTPTDIGSDEFTPASTPPSATASGAPSFSGTTTYTFAGRTLGSITWGASGTLPSSVDFKYYSGTLPPPFVTGQANFIRSYWDISVPDGSGYTYNLTLNYTDPGEINAIPELNLAIAQRSGGNPWVNQGGAANQTNNTCTVTGLTGFSQFTLNDNNSPLPIQLAYFRGAEVQNQGVRLEWRTISEVNNYGFFVQRKRANETDWTQVNATIIPGHGTTNEPHDYSYLDNTVARGSWQYRLKQVDLDGTEHFIEPINVSMVTSVKEVAPIEFALKQNYPNPFNPETNIKFSVEQTGRATLEIYNLLGQKVATLFDEEVEAGYYQTVKFNGANLASGMYLYRLQSGKKSDLKKLMLVK